MKKSRSDRCVFCLKYFNEENPDDRRTDEHIFPKSWYPDSTPDNIEKWQVFSCHSCNEEYSKIEDNLFSRLGLCIPHNQAKTSGIPEKALRSLTPRYAKNKRDRKLRMAKREKILKEIEMMKSQPDEGYLPNFEGKPGKQNQTRLAIRADYLEKLAEKLIRGMTFRIDSILIEEDYQIDFSLLRDDNSGFFMQKIRSFGETFYREPGIVVGRAVPHGDPKSSLYYIEIWGQLKIYGTVTKKKKNRHHEE